ncbi:DUF413 domain-containing protein [Marinobacteraceae bacterium S3BR75-40.1]
MHSQYSEFETNRAFFDDRRFPRGFARSGEFTLKEAELLTKHGALLKDLTEGRLAPSNAAQKHFLSVVEGAAEAEHPLEKVWLKYLGLTTRRVIRFSCSTPASEGDYSHDSLSDF